MKIGYVLLGTVVLFVTGTAKASVVITSSLDNITLGTTALGSSPNTVADPSVLPGGIGAKLSYTSSATTSAFAAPYGLANLNDNDGQSLSASDGTYAIIGTTGGATTLTLTFTGGAQQIGGFAISNGYTGRDNGSYTITDALGGIQGTYSITTATASDTHAGTDVFYIAFDAPVSTTALNFAITSATEQNSVSFREIEVFSAVPEPTSIGLLGLVAAGALGRRRARS